MCQAFIKRTKYCAHTVTHPHGHTQLLLSAVAVCEWTSKYVYKTHTCSKS